MEESVTFTIQFTLFRYQVSKETAESASLTLLLPPLSHTLKHIKNRINHLTYNLS